MSAYRAKIRNGESWPVVFKKSQGYKDKIVLIPCGKCIECRLEKQRQWAIRCKHEARLWKENCFITITYNDESIPYDWSVRKAELQNFFKRLRRNLEKNGRNLKKNPIRYFACGEYGDRKKRPHYHAILFNYKPEDLVPFDKSISKFGKIESIVYKSEFLEEAWQNKGNVVVGEFNFNTASYVANYTMKKRVGKPDQVDRKGKKNYKYYERVDYETGEIFDVVPEFTLSSRKPGIGGEWIKKYYKQVMAKDQVVINKGLTTSVPAYYNKKIKETFPDRYKEILLERRKKKKVKDLNELAVRDKYREVNHSKTKRGKL